MVMNPTLRSRLLLLEIIVFNLFQMPPIPSSPRSASRALIQDSQTQQHLTYIDDCEERCPTRAQLPNSAYAPRKIVTVSKNQQESTVYNLYELKAF